MNVPACIPTAAPGKPRTTTQKATHSKYQLSVESSTATTKGPGRSSAAVAW